MTHETKRKVKAAAFARMREKAVSCLHAMGADAGIYEPDSWEGVMTMLKGVLDGRDSGKQASAILAAAKWMHAHLECETMKEVDEASEMVEREMAAAKEGDEKGSGSAAGARSMESVRSALAAQFAKPSGEAR